MSKQIFERGNRVTSKIAGFYYGLPGRILGASQIQYGGSRIYIVELDAGKRISLPEHHIRKLDTDQ